MLVAKAIMDAAKSGERDPKRLREFAVRELTAQVAPSIAPDDTLPWHRRRVKRSEQPGPSATTVGSAAEGGALGTFYGLDVPTSLTSK
jgi:hypothetical protein